MSNVMSEYALSLWKSEADHLDTLMVTGVEPSDVYLSGYLFRGLNVGFLAKLIGKQKFIKSLYKTSADGEFLAGHNLMVKQNDPDEEYIKLFENGNPRPEGYFLVRPAKDNAKWSHYRNAKFLSYGITGKKNTWYQKLLRDYLVRIPGKDILIGRAYFSVGPFQIPGPFFILEKIED